MDLKQDHSAGKSELPQGQVNGFGNYEELGKTEARRRFLSLVENVSHEAKSVAITDGEMIVAVLMGYKQFQRLMDLLSQENGNLQKKPLAGLILGTGDLDADSEKVNALFQASLKNT